MDSRPGTSRHRGPGHLAGRPGRRRRARRQPRRRRAQHPPGHPAVLPLPVPRPVPGLPPPDGRLHLRQARSACPPTTGAPTTRPPPSTPPATRTTRAPSRPPNSCSTRSSGQFFADRIFGPGRAALLAAQLPATCGTSPASKSPCSPRSPRTPSRPSPASPTPARTATTTPATPAPTLTSPNPCGIWATPLEALERHVHGIPGCGGTGYLWWFTEGSLVRARREADGRAVRGRGVLGVSRAGTAEDRGHWGPGRRAASGAAARPRARAG